MTGYKNKEGFPMANQKNTGIKYQPGYPLILGANRMAEGYNFGVEAQEQDEV